MIFSVPPPETQESLNYFHLTITLRIIKPQFYCLHITDKKKKNYF